MQKSNRTTTNDIAVDAIWYYLEKSRRQNANRDSGDLAATSS